MLRSNLLAAALVVSSSAIGAGVEDEKPYDDRPYVDIMFTFVDTDEDRNLGESSFGGSGIFGLPLAEHWSWESQLGFYTLESRTDNATDFYQLNVNTGLRYHVGDQEHFTPFLLAGIGIISNDVVPDSDDSTNLMLNFGAGLLTPKLFDTEMRMRLEVRYLYDDFSGAAGNVDIPSSEGEGGFSDLHVSIGLHVPIGGPTTIKETFTTQPFIDSDGDSIADEYDLCPNTLANAKVDAQGCIVKNQILILRNINFELSSDRIEESTYPVLDELVIMLKKHNDINMDIVGHSDSTGPADFNQKLSEQRAQSIRTYLVEHGIIEDRITASGMGPSQPVADNKTVSGRAMNRRVEFRIMEQQSGD